MAGRCHLGDNNLHRESKMQHHAKEQFTFAPRDRRILQELEKDVSSIKTAKHKARLPVNTAMRQDILGHYDLEQSVNGISHIDKDSDKIPCRTHKYRIYTKLAARQTSHSE
jgi:hypothetical protein